MTRKDRTEGIYSRREVLDESERRQYCLIQLKDLLSYAYRYSEDVKKRFDRAQFNVEKFKTLSDMPMGFASENYILFANETWRPCNYFFRFKSCPTYINRVFVDQMLDIELSRREMRNIFMWEYTHTVENVLDLWLHENWKTLPEEVKVEMKQMSKEEYIQCLVNMSAFAGDLEGIGKKIAEETKSKAMDSLLAYLDSDDHKNFKIIERSAEEDEDK